MKLYELLQIRNIISNRISIQANLPANLAYKIMKLIKNTQADADFYQEKYSAILQEYAQLDENGQPLSDEKGGIKIKEGMVQECIQKINELNATEITPIDIHFTLKELEPYEFSIQDMAMLDGIIKE